VRIELPEGLLELKIKRRQKKDHQRKERGGQSQVRGLGEKEGRGGGWNRVHDYGRGI